MREPDLLHRDGLCLTNVHRILEEFIDGVLDDAPDYLPTVSADYVQPYLQYIHAAEDSGKGEDNFDTHYNILMGVLPELCAPIRVTAPLSNQVRAGHEIIRAMRHLL